MRGLRFARARIRHVHVQRRNDPYPIRWDSVRLAARPALQHRDLVPRVEAVPGEREVAREAERAEELGEVGADEFEVSVDLDVVIARLLRVEPPAERVAPAREPGRWCAYACSNLYSNFLIFFSKL